MRSGMIRKRLKMMAIKILSRPLFIMWPREYEVFYFLGIQK